MPTSLNRRAYAELATSAVSAGEAFAYWREMICATFVRLAAEPTAAGRFSGRIEHVPMGDLEMSAVVAGGQHVRRTRSLIAQGSEEYLLASIQRSGTGRVEQDGRIALLSPGDMAFYDSTRPYTLHFDEPFHQLVVQVPKRELMLRDTRPLTARALRHGTPGGAVSAFFTSLFDATRASATPLNTTPPSAHGASPTEASPTEASPTEASPTEASREQPAVLLPHAMGLLSAAALFADGSQPAPAAATALARQRVLEFLRRNLADPGLDADAVAAACHVSRRTLYRVLGSDGVATRLRQMRIEQAQAMLLREPGRPVAAVGFACGFDSESGFHRAFRTATGMTPGEFRRSWHAG
jgi:AraC-like DNA-binding protein